jgi:DNA-binding XRE family transcriptional regulator|nr:MAG TPA: SOS-response transcriptional repressor [Caudoviricetes sp.]
MLTGLKAEQARAGLTNREVADALGIAVNTYILKKRTGKFYLEEIQALIDLFGCSFETLFGRREQSHEK